jgi:hypothetical protein
MSITLKIVSVAVAAVVVAIVGVVITVLVLNYALQPENGPCPLKAEEISHMEPSQAREAYMARCGLPQPGNGWQWNEDLTVSPIGAQPNKNRK